MDSTPVGPRHVDLHLTGTVRLADALTAVYVLLPVLDDAKHHYVGPAEADKLMRAGECWLADHPERELITRRYLRYRRQLTAPLLERLGIGDEGETPPTQLRELRRRAVLAELHAVGARRVLDLGCGEGALLAELLRDMSFTEIVGIDTSVTSLDRAVRRLRLDELPPAARSRITLRQSSLIYTDRELAGYDAAVLSEVVEHVEPDRLTSLEQSVFAVARPTTVVVTTPNREYNARYPNLARERCAIPTTVSSGRARSSRPGPSGSAPSMATASGTRGSAIRTPHSTPRRSWPCLPGAAHDDPGALPGGAGRGERGG